MRFNFMVLLMLFSIPSVMASEHQQDVLKQEAQKLVQQFVGQMKPQLKKAMEEGGPTQAIESCATLAPAIADAMSAQSGWKVRRVSLKTRNASRAEPDDWERSVLIRFDQRQAAGELPPTINFGEIEDGNYRYMQAQGVEPVCLVCHGELLSASVKEMLDQYYPNEQARGYAMGQLRGAISLTKLLACDEPNDKDSKICQVAHLN
jgi:hypothetical protein